MQMRRQILPLFVAVVVVHGCNCDDVVGAQAPDAVLVFNDQNAPPLDNLDVGLGAGALGTPLSARFTIENRGNVPLNVSDLVLAAHPQLCPTPSGGFVIAAPAAATPGGPRAFAIKQGDSQEVQVSFTPTSGQPACTVVEVRSDDSDHPVLFARLSGQGDAPQLCADKGVVDFGTVVVGDHKDDTVTFTSCGTRPVTLSATTLNAMFPEPFETTPPTTPQTLAVGESVTFPVAFDPEEPGQFSGATGNSGVIDFETDTVDLYRVELIGVAQLPPSCRLQVIPNAVQFGSVGATRSSTQTVFIRNVGELDCTFTSAEIVTGAPFTRQLVDLAPGDVLGPQQGGSLTVTFAPTDAVGAQNDILRVLSDDPVNPTIDVPLEGNSVELTPCFLEASPTAVNFGNRTVGRQTEQTVTLTNVGSETCLVTDIVVTTGRPEFDVIASSFTQIDIPIIGNFFGAIVPEGGSIETIVTFRADQTGPRFGNVQFTYKEQGFNNPDQTLDVPATGFGVGACVEVTPLDVDFGSVATGASADRVVNVRNCGASDLSLRGLTLRSGSHPDFHVTAAPTLPSRLLAGEQQQVTVRASPTAAGTAQAGTQMFGVLDVLTDDVTHGVNLRANTNGACQAGGLVCTPRTLDFGDVLVGEDLVRSIVCNNPNSAPVTINPTVGAPFSIASAPAQIPGNGQGVIRVRFDAASASAASGTVNVGANDCSGSAVAVAVRGAGTEEDIPACPTPEAFVPETTWKWDGTNAQTEGGSHEVWTTPLVARLEDTTGDGAVTRDDMPRVIVVSFDHNDVSPPVGGQGSSSINDPIPSNLRALAGDDGHEVWTVTAENLKLQSEETPAIIDLDGDGRVEIIAQKYILLPGVADIPGGPEVNGKFSRGSLLVFNFDGTLKFESDEWSRRQNELEDGGAPAVGDVDGDGFAEIATGDILYDHNGRILWRGDGTKIGSTGHGPTSVLADVDGQPGLELVCGTRVFRANGTILWDRPDLADGHPAVADLDGDGKNEVVVRGSELFVLNGQTGASLSDPFVPATQSQMGKECEAPAGGGGGGEGQDDPCNIIPTNVAILDFDGDGTREIISANHELITGYHWTGTQLDEVFRNNPNEGAANEGGISDGTGAAGPAGFDFEGNSSQEIVYSDEAQIHAWSDEDGLVYANNRGSATIFEYSTIADVDLDGHADLLVVSNSFLIPATFGGVEVMHNQGTSWAQARSVWNQHAYVEDLVNELGTPLFSDGTALIGFRTTRARCE